MKVNTKPKLVVVSAKIPAEMREAIERVAEKEARSISNAVFRLLSTHPLLIDAKKETALAK